MGFFGRLGGAIGGALGGAMGGGKKPGAPGGAFQGLKQPRMQSGAPTTKSPGQTGSRSVISTFRNRKMSGAR